ncbi:MAG: substrate-binding domain-containing protein [Actinobacteria bacterium]|nr:substrate-binding domain-containing protein [Actinomycetota bacterium]
MASAGSDTSEGVMTSIMNSYRNENAGAGRPVTVGGSVVNAHSYNVPASPVIYDNLAGNRFTVPGESATATDCPNDINWAKDPLAPGGSTAPTRGIAPFGSGAGRNYLAAENGGTGPNPAGSAETAGQNFGCIDVARSSGAPRGTGQGDKSTFEYYAFALDALSWATTSLKAPAVLTHDQIKQIYLCNITDWSQVGGAPGPIVRYLPQSGSGTRSFFISDILGGVTPNNSNACGGGGDRTLREIEENQAVTIAPADQDKAILPYSAALWTYQTTNSINPTIDRRCPSRAICARLGYITTTGGNVTASPVTWNDIDVNYQLDTAGVVIDANVKHFANNGGAGWNEATGSFIGVRHIYNVLDAVGTGGGRRGYQAAKQLVGFDNSPGGTKSPLCDASTSKGQLLQAFIVTAGFAPLTNANNATSNQANSNCRFYQGVN